MDKTLTDQTKPKDKSEGSSALGADKSAEKDTDDHSGSAGKQTGQLVHEWLTSLSADKTSAVPIQPVKDIDKSHPFRILPNKPEDPSKHTVFVVDDFRYHDVEIKGEYGFSHGELSSRMAEENDLNVKRFQINVRKDGGYDMAKSLGELAKRIDSGELRFEPGTAVNLSFGLSMTYDAVGEGLNMSLSPDNIKEKRQQVLEKLEQLLSDDSFTVYGEALKNAAEINRSIQQLQERGLKVISSAGNEGPDYINIGFLAADKQYSALTRDGKLADYSGKNNYTEDGRGQVDFYFHNVDLTDPKSISRQQGYYSVDGTDIKLDAGEFGGRRFDKTKAQAESLKILDADLHRDLSSETGRKFDYRRLHEVQTGLRQGESIATAYGTGRFIKDPSEGFTQLTSGMRTAINPFNLQKLTTVPSKLDFNQLRKGKLAADTFGTSFVNVFKIKDEFI